MDWKWAAKPRRPIGARTGDAHLGDSLLIQTDIPWRDPPEGFGNCRVLDIRHVCWIRIGFLQPFQRVK